MFTTGKFQRNSSSVKNTTRITSNIDRDKKNTNYLGMDTGIAKETVNDIPTGHTLLPTLYDIHLNGNLRFGDVFFSNMIFFKDDFFSKMIFLEKYFE